MNRQAAIGWYIVCRGELREILDGFDPVTIPVPPQGNEAARREDLPMIVREYGSG